MSDWQGDGGGGTATYSSDNPFAGASAPSDQGPQYSADNPFAKPTGYSPDNPFAKPVATPRAPAPDSGVRPPKPGEEGQLNLADPTPYEARQLRRSATDRAAIAQPAASDATRLRRPGEAPAGPDPVAATLGTAARIAVAPVETAAKAGLYLGRAANDAIGTDGRDANVATANELASAMHVPDVSDKDALVSAAQLAAMGLGPLVGKLAGKVTGATLAPLVAKYGPKALAAMDDPTLATALGNVAEHATSGGLVGASYDPEHPARGFAIGAGLGVAANELAAAADRPMRNARRFSREATAAASAEPVNRLANPEAPVRARVVDEPAPPTEPDYTIEPLEREYSPDNPFAGRRPSTAPQLEAPATPKALLGAGKTDVAPASDGTAPGDTITEAHLAEHRKTLDAMGLRTISPDEALRMSPEQLRAYADTAKSAEQSMDAKALDPETLKAYNAASRTANSSMAPPAKIEAASARMSEIEDALTPQQRLMLFGDRRVAYTGAEDARAMAEAAQESSPTVFLHDEEAGHPRPTPDLLSDVGRLVTTGNANLGHDRLHPAALIQLRGTVAELQRRGLDLDTILQDALKERVRRGHASPGDAVEVARTTLEKLQQSGALGSRQAPSTAPTPAALPAPKTPGLGRVIDEDGVARLETARTPGGARRPVTSVSTNGLLQELLDLEPKRAAAENRAPYEVREDKSFATSGFPQIVSTKDKNGGPSMQAKAARNLADFARITDEIFAELHARGIDNYAAIERVEDLRAQHDERAGMAGDYSPTNLGRGAVHDDQGKVLFAQAAGGATSSARAPRGARKATAPNPAPPAGGKRFNTPPPAPLTQRVPAAVAQSVANHLGALRSTFAPSTVSAVAGKTARIFRQELGAQAHDYEQAVESLKQFAHMFDRMPVPDTRAFIDNMERDLAQATPELTAAAKALRELMDTLRDRIRGLGTGRLENFIEHYFPHVWKDPTTASAVFARIMGAKRPFEGSKSFLKQRTIPLFADGVNAGLEPVTENPVELVLLKVREMRRFLTAHQTMQRLIDDNLASYVPATMKAPHGLTRLNDAIATVFGPPTVTTSEAFDLHIRGALEQTIKNLDAISPLEHERKVRLGGGKLGYAYSSGDKMATKFGSHDGVMMHELGHILDARYGLWKKLSADVRTVKELEDLAAERYRGQIVKPSFKKYTRKPPELIANAVHAYLHAPELMGQVAPTTQLLLAKFFASRPELKPLLDAAPSLVLTTGTADIPVGGIVIKGAYWAPQDVARVFNNHLSPGLRGKPWYDSAAFLNNALNTVQLGLSGFHLGFVALDTSVSQTAVALQNLFAGRLSLAASQAIQIPVAPVTSFLRGNKLYNAYLSAGTLSPALKQSVEHVIAAGGRVKSDSFYHLGAVDKFLKAIRQGRYGAAAGWSIPAVFDATVKPTLEYYVPRAKLGVFLQLAEHELADLPHGATSDDQLAALQRAWDSVDNRLGQLVYDNLFWGKTFKDLSQIAVRAVGWNLGVLREIPGGAADLARLGVGAARGKPADFSLKAAYVMALPMVVGLLGAVTTYLLTGHGPKELRDYYYPPTGRTNPDGDQERLTPPSYVRDVVSYWRHTGDTIVHKLAPFWDLVMSSIENKDFFGDKIRNPDDPFMTRLKQEAQYIGRTAMPLGVQNAREAAKREQTTTVKALGFFGMGQAPRDLTRSAAENKIEEYMGAKMPRGATPEESEARRARGDLRLRMRADPKGGGAAADSAEDAGMLTHAQHVRLDRANESDPWLDRFKRLTVEQALHVWKVATPEEQAAWRDALDTKLTRAGRDDEMPPEPRPRFTRP